MGATEWWAAGALAVRPRLTNYSFSFPEQVRHRYLLHRGVEVRRFELPACRIDHRGFCRYPGEVAALVYATPPRPSRGCGDWGAVCGAVWSTKFAEPDDEICWRTKGWYACEIDWNDPGCCRLKQACMEWRRRCTTHAAPKRQGGAGRKSKRAAWNRLASVSNHVTIRSAPSPPSLRRPARGGTTRRAWRPARPRTRPRASRTPRAP